VPRRRPGPWVDLGFPTRAAYRAAQQALGIRHYPLESKHRKEREGAGFGHGPLARLKAQLRKHEGDIRIRVEGRTRRGVYDQHTNQWIPGSEITHRWILVEAEESLHTAQESASIHEFFDEVDPDADGWYGPLEWTIYDL
jgi:hypothetical protein